MTLVYWSQPSSAVLCIQNIDFSIRITSIYGAQQSFVAFARKKATLGPELQVSMCPRPHLSFCACKTVIFASELQVSVGLSLHLCFLPAQQRL